MPPLPCQLLDKPRMTYRAVRAAGGPRSRGGGGSRVVRRAAGEKHVLETRPKTAHQSSLLFHRTLTISIRVRRGIAGKKKKDYRRRTRGIMFKFRLTIKLYSIDEPLLHDGLRMLFRRVYVAKSIAGYKLFFKDSTERRLHGTTTLRLYCGRENRLLRIRR